MSDSAFKELIIVSSFDLLDFTTKICENTQKNDQVQIFKGKGHKNILAGNFFQQLLKCNVFWEVKLKVTLSVL